MKIVAEMWGCIQSSLFPFLSECLDDSLTENLKLFIRVLEVIRIEDHVPSPYSQRLGRKQHDRRPIARAFIAKAVFNIPDTNLLIEMIKLQPTLRRLCGWERRRDIPSEATFCRAFAQFAQANLGDQVHAELVKVHVRSEVVMHVSRDATDVPAREKACKKIRRSGELTEEEKKQGKKRGKNRDYTPYLAIQLKQTAQEAIAELPRVCDFGYKVNSKQKKYSWIGWKAHIDWTDGAIPVNVLTTSASMHDCRAAIPMLRVTAERITSLYDLMDSAYHCSAIKEVSRELGHVPIIDINKSHKSAIPFDTATAIRYRERTTAERGNSRLKDDFGLRHLRVRGHSKAHLHIMFGILALFADQLMKPIVG